jgi:hypothetical protein
MFKPLLQLEVNLSGQRDTNLRSGHFQENFGILMLQSISAVAHVSHPEDVGIDAICTLLENTPSSLRRLFARESFAVQLKASSVKFLEFSPQEVEWLLKLELPLFIGVVSMNTSELRLHTLNNLVRQLHLTQANKCPEGIAIELIPNSYTGSKPTVNIGTPIVCWSLSDAKGLREKIVAIMRKWCELEQFNLRMRPQDSGEFYLWDTNCLPSIDGCFYSSSGSERAIEALKRPIETLALAGLSASDCEQQWRLWRPMIEFLELNSQLSPGSLAIWDSTAQACIKK